MATYNKFKQFVLHLNDLTDIDFTVATGTLKVLLTNTSPATHDDVGEWDTYTDVTGQITGTGYTATGETLTITVSDLTGPSGAYWLKATAAVPTWTAGAGDWTAFQYIVLYDPASGKLIAWFDYGSPVTLANGETFTIVPDATNGVLQIV